MNEVFDDNFWENVDFSVPEDFFQDILKNTKIQLSEDETNNKSEIEDI